MTQTVILKGMNRTVLFSLFACLIVFALPAAAQQSRTTDGKAAPSTQAAPTVPAIIAPNVGAADMQDSEVTVMKDDFAHSAYVTPNIQNLSKLYWRLGIFNPNDKAVVDNFLIINECDVYQNFFNDDFEWANVRKATREMLKEQAPTFPNQFKILVPIDLGRYNVDRGGFELVNNTAFVNSRRVQVTANNFFTGCGKKDDLPGYPSNVVMILNKPFTFNFVKVDEHVAQAFLLRKKYNEAPLPKELRNKGFQRIAFARMRVTFVRYQGTDTGHGGRKDAILYGKLDGIDIFEDMKEEMLLTSINYQ